MIDEATNGILYRPIGPWADHHRHVRTTADGFLEGRRCSEGGCDLVRYAHDIEASGGHFFLKYLARYGGREQRVTPVQGKRGFLRSARML